MAATWLDSGAEVAESLRHWITRLATVGTPADFSPQQLEFLEELLKAGMLGMAKVIADRLAKLERRLAQCEAATSTESESEKVATNMGSSKTKSRRQRRQRVKKRQMDGISFDRRLLATSGAICSDEPRTVISLWDALYGAQSEEVIDFEFHLDDVAQSGVWEYVSDSEETMEMTLGINHTEISTCGGDDNHLSPLREVCAFRRHEAKHAVETVENMTEAAWPCRRKATHQDFLDDHVSSSSKCSSLACCDLFPCQFLTFGTEDDTMHAAFSCKVAASALTHMSLAMHGVPASVIATISHPHLPGPPSSPPCVQLFDVENVDGEVASADQF